MTRRTHTNWDLWFSLRRDLCVPRVHFSPASFNQMNVLKQGVMCVGNREMRL